MAHHKCFLYLSSTIKLLINEHSILEVNEWKSVDYSFKMNKLISVHKIIGTKKIIDAKKNFQCNLCVPFIFIRKIFIRMRFFGIFIDFLFGSLGNLKHGESALMRCKRVRCKRVRCKYDLYVNHSCISLSCVYKNHT